MRRTFLFLVCLVAVCVPARAGVLGDDITEDEAHDYNGMPRWRLALETGYSQWLYNPDSVSQSYNRYLNILESGWDFSAQADWFPWPRGGIGAEWIWFLSNAQRDGVRVDSAGPAYDMRDRVSAIYYGAVFLTRAHFGRFGLLVGAFGAGLLDFHYDWTANGKPYRVEARTFAVVPEVGWEYACYRLVSVGINARAVLADLKDYTLNGKKVTIKQPDDPHSWSTIGLTRLELNAGIRFGMD